MNFEDYSKVLPGEERLFANGMNAMAPMRNTAPEAALKTFPIKRDLAEFVALHGFAALFEKEMDRRLFAEIESRRPPQLGCARLGTESLLDIDDDVTVADMFIPSVTANSNISVATYFDSL